MKKNYTKEEALAIINDPEKKITELSIGIDNPEKGEGPLTEEGFEIPKDFILASYKKMLDMGASEIEARFIGARTLMGATITLKINKARWCEKCNDLLDQETGKICEVCEGMK